MPKISSQQLKLMRQLLGRLEAVVASLEEESNAELMIPEEVLQRFAAATEAGTCLSCDSPLGARPARGLCQSCFNRANFRMNQNEVTETELILAGAMMPAGMFKRQKKREKLVDQVGKPKDADLGQPSSMKDKVSKEVEDVVRRAKQKGIIPTKKIPPAE